MRELTVNTRPAYRILIGRGLMKELGALLPRRYGRIAILSDDKVFALYGGIVTAALRSTGAEVVCCTFPHGEARKTPQTFLQLVGFLAENALTRSDLVVALGGGVTGDLAGFAAAVYLRGIDCIQIPTSLLAMVDSSVGGKTGVDLPQGKNLMGVFSQPGLVVCDPDALQTLPEEEFRNGIGEVIKYGAIADRRLFESVEGGTVGDREELIERCLSIKKRTVEEDVDDRGIRRILNFGHTLGHGIERLSNFRIAHGQAVAMGMCRITRWAERRGLTPSGVAARLERTVSAFGMETDCPFGGTELFEAALYDKKRRGGSLTLVLLKEIGSCYLYELDLSAEDGCDF